MRHPPALSTTGLLLAALLLSVAGPAGQSIAATAGNTPTRTAAATKSSTPVPIRGYTAHVPAAILDATPGVAAVLTPYGLVWSSYADAVDTRGIYGLPHPFAVLISPSGGRGPLEGTGRLLAQLPADIGLQSVDLHFVGASGPYLGFTLDLGGTVTTLAAGTIDLRSGKVDMVPGRVAMAAGALMAGSRLGLIAPRANYVFDPADGRLATYPAGDATWLATDLAYGLPIGQPPAVPSPAQGISSYAAGGMMIYGPPGWRLSESRVGETTLWQLRDPGDPHAVIQVATSRCTGCTTIGTVAGALETPPIGPPAASGAGSFQTGWLSDFARSYQGTAPGYIYPVLGVGIAPVPGASGSVNVAISLPATQKALAQAVLRSYPIPH